MGPRPTCRTLMGTVSLLKKGINCRISRHPMRLLLPLVLPVVWVLLLALTDASAPQVDVQSALPAAAAGTGTSTNPGLADRALPGHISPSNASYALSASLDPLNHRIAGEGTLVW